MKPIALFLTLAALASSSAADDGPVCPGQGAGGQSANWGANYRTIVEEDVYKTVRAQAGIPDTVPIINVNALGGKNANRRTVNGTPLAAMPKGAEGLQTDAVIYTFGILEIVCDKAQLAYFIAHEMRHLLKVNGKNHFDRVNDCRKELFNQWAAGTDLSAYPDDKSAIAAFAQAKGGEISTKCILPVEKEADEFAFDLMNKLPQYKTTNADPKWDARSRAFTNAETWAVATGESPCDPGHGCLGDRAKAAADAAKKQHDKQHEAEERFRGQSFAPL